MKLSDSRLYGLLTDAVRTATSKDRLYQVFNMSILALLYYHSNLIAKSTKVLLTTDTDCVITYAMSYDTSYDVKGIAMDKIQNKVKKLRRKMGWTQEYLARQIDVSLATVQRWEASKTTPSRLAQKELSRLFRKAEMD
ncbi:helix-turn-helix transcriptional regulator [Chloroflexota bacterium]